MKTGESKIIIHLYPHQYPGNMQFLLMAYDGTDAGAADRRLKVRPEHLDKVSVLKKEGKVLFGGAILDDAGNMKGSMIVYEVPGREALDELLKDEPYVYGGVWKEINITPFRLANIG